GLAPMQLESWTRRIKQVTAVALALVATPIAVTLVAHFIINYQRQEQYNRCLAALAPSALDNPGVSTILEDLSRTDAYRDVRWNINRPYQVGALNIIMPSKTPQWPAACQLGAEQADCLASPRHRYVICNPAMGREFASPLLLSGIANVQ